MKTEKIYKCYCHGCHNSGIFPVVCHDNKSPESGFHYVCKEHLKAHAKLDESAFHNINNHCVSVNEWTVTATTKKIDNMTFYSLQRDGWQVARNGYHGAIGANVQAMNSIGKYIQCHSEIFDMVNIYHYRTGVLMAIPADDMHKGFKLMRDRLNKNCMKAIEKSPYFIGYADK